jgi:predicted HNH restriction endonuclease
MNFWWCNQGHGWDDEHDAGVVRASDVVSNPTFRKTVGEARARDIIVHYRTPHVVAFSRAEEDGRYEDDLPEGYGSGWEFRSEYHELHDPLHRDAFRDEIAVPPEKGFAFDTRRNVRQGYFFRFSADGLAAVLGHVSPAERLPAWLSVATAEPPPVEEQETRLREGTRYVAHLKRERNRRLAEEAKRIHSHVCQVCGFDFERFYGSAGAGYIEAHHKVPFHTLPEDAEVMLSPKDDFAVVCANCHRMLHREPYPTVAELRAIVAERRRS